MESYTIFPQEKIYLRDLAKKQLEYASRPVMREREALWYRHNDMQDSRPMVFIETDTFWNDIMPELKCSTALGREIESHILKEIASAELIDDDKVVPDFYEVEIHLEHQKFGVEQKKTYADDGLGYHIEPVLEILENDFEKLSPTRFGFDEPDFILKCNCIREVIGDVLPIKIVNGTNKVYLTNLF